MHSILDRVAARPSYGEFRPQTVREFFALRLAQKLGDVSAARYYLDLTEQHSEERLLIAYRRARANSATGDFPRAFHKALERLNGNGTNGGAKRLFAIKVERRSVSLAVFVGTQLDYTQTRQLSSDREEAEASAVGFVNSMMSHFETESAAMERIDTEQEIQRLTTSRAIASVLREHMLSMWEVQKHDLLTAFAQPEPRSRREMREIVKAIWPVLGADAGILDAAGLGLYVQTERLFSFEQ